MLYGEEPQTFALAKVQYILAGKTASFNKKNPPLEKEKKKERPGTTQKGKDKRERKKKKKQ